MIQFVDRISLFKKWENVSTGGTRTRSSRITMSAAYHYTTQELQQSQLITILMYHRVLVKLSHYVRSFKFWFCRTPQNVNLLTLL